MKKDRLTSSQQIIMDKLQRAKGGAIAVGYTRQNPRTLRSLEKRGLIRFARYNVESRLTTVWLCDQPKPQFYSYALTNKFGRIQANGLRIMSEAEAAIVNQYELGRGLDYTWERGAKFLSDDDPELKQWIIKSLGEAGCDLSMQRHMASARHISDELLRRHATIAYAFDVETILDAMFKAGEIDRLKIEHELFYRIFPLLRHEVETVFFAECPTESKSLSASACYGLLCKKLKFAPAYVEVVVCLDALVLDCKARVTAHKLDGYHYAPLSRTFSRCACENTACHFPHADGDCKATGYTLTQGGRLCPDCIAFMPVEFIVLEDGLFYWQDGEDRIYNHETDTLRGGNALDVAIARASSLYRACDVKPYEAA